jgi:hypothetical protein
MPSILASFDKQLLPAWSKVAPPPKLERAELIRQAVRDPMREREFDAIREAYLRQPDSVESAEDWANAEEWKA